MIGKQVSEAALDGWMGAFYKWDGPVSSLLNGVRDSLNEMKGELEEAKAQLKKKKDEKSGTSRDAIMIIRLHQKCKGLLEEYRKKEKELIESRDDNLRTQVMHDDNLSFKPSLQYCKQARRVKCPRGE